VQQDKYYGSRKFILSVGVELLASILLVYGFIPVEVWKEVTLTNIFVYSGSNVAYKYVENKNAGTTN
jgi:hypothetical protein